ncbi:MAG TPA: ABC transporter permease [Symbiobacteriaceae bacterium]|jgi:ABC-2 type transport system permease protein
MKALIALYQAAAREFLRDKVVILLTVLLPIILAAFFGMLFSGGAGKFHLDLGVAVEDKGPVGGELAKVFTGPALKETVTVHSGTRDELIAQLKQGKVAVVAVMPAELTANAGARQPTNVEVIWDKTRESAAAPGVAMVRQILQEAGLKLQGAAPLLVMQENVIETRSTAPVLLYVPGMMGLAILWLGIFTVAPPLVQMRESQVLRRLGATPLSRGTLLGAQIGWRLTTGLIQAALLIGYGIVVLHMHVDNWLLTVAADVLGTAVMISLGFLLAGLARSNESCVALGQMIQFPMMFLSGILFPIEMLPKFLLPVAKLMPLTYIGDALKQTMLGTAPLMPLWVDFAVMGGCLVLLSGLSVRFFRWE